MSVSFLFQIENGMVSNFYEPYSFLCSLMRQFHYDLGLFLNFGGLSRHRDSAPPDEHWENYRTWVLASLFKGNDTGLGRW